MKEEQKSDLLKQIRKKAKVEITFLKENLNSTTDKFVEIEGQSLERKRVEHFIETLRKASEAETVESLKNLLKGDTIPLEMLMASKRWESLQRLIFKLHDND